MANYIPEPGDKFYCRIKPRTRQETDLYGNVNTVTIEDGSYREDIFECIVADDTHMVAKRLTWCVGNGRKLFLKSEYIFDPVGPGILDALELDKEEL